MGGAKQAEALLELLTGDELRECADYFEVARGGNRSVLIARIGHQLGGDAEKLVRSRFWPVEVWREAIADRTNTKVGRGYRGIEEYLSRISAQAAASSAALASSYAPAVSTSGDRRPLFQNIDTGGPPPPSLWPYQDEAVKALQKLVPGRGGILCLPTGSGKTKTAVWWMLSLIAAQGGRVLWLAGRSELITQAAKDVENHAALMRPRGSRFSMRVIEGGSGPELDGDVIVASIDTLVGRPEVTAAGIDRTGRVTAIVYDEAHHAPAPTYRELLRRLQADRRLLLGLSATPIRTKPSEGAALTEIFPAKIVHQVTYIDLMNKGILAYPKHKIVTLDGTIDVSEAHAAYIAQHGELPSALKTRLAQDEPRAQRVANEVLQLRDQLRPMIVFAVGREDGRRIRDLLVQRGMPTAEYVDGETPRAVRKQLVEGLCKGTIEALVNVEVLTEGTDVPNLRGVVIARPTFSETLYRQMVGRGSRGPLVKGGKPVFTVLDFQDNFSRFKEHLACRFALDAEITPERATPAPSTPRKIAPQEQPSVPPGVLDAWRVAVAEVMRSSDAPSAEEMNLAGWWTWAEPTHPEYMLVFAHERAHVNAMVEEIGRRVANLLPSQNDIAAEAAAYLYNEQLFGTALAWRKFEALARALHARRDVRFEVFVGDVPPDLHRLHRDASAYARTETWLAEQYDAHPMWVLHYPTRESFVGAVLAVGERDGSNDTVRDQPAFVIGVIAAVENFDVRLLSHGPHRTVVVRLLTTRAGFSIADAVRAVETPGTLVARSVDRGRAELLRDILENEGAEVRVAPTT